MTEDIDYLIIRLGLWLRDLGLGQIRVNHRFRNWLATSVASFGLNLAVPRLKKYGML